MYSCTRSFGNIIEPTSCSLPQMVVLIKMAFLVFSCIFSLRFNLYNNSVSSMFESVTQMSEGLGIPGFMFHHSNKEISTAADILHFV